MWRPEVTPSETKYLRMYIFPQSVVVQVSTKSDTFCLETGNGQIGLLNEKIVCNF